MVDLGGNDLSSGILPPRLLVDKYINLYRNAAHCIVFCSIINRKSSNMGVTPEEFESRAQDFNARLKDRVADSPHLHFWAHQRFCDKYLARDGVHLNESGMHNLLMSFRLAVKAHCPAHPSHPRPILPAFTSPPLLVRPSS